MAPEQLLAWDISVNLLQSPSIFLLFSWPAPHCVCPFSHGFTPAIWVRNSNFYWFLTKIFCMQVFHELVILHRCSATHVWDHMFNQGALYHPSPFLLSFEMFLPKPDEKQPHSFSSVEKPVEWFCSYFSPLRFPFVFEKTLCINLCWTNTLYFWEDIARRKSCLFFAMCSYNYVYAK